METIWNHKKYSHHISLENMGKKNKEIDETKENKQ